MLCFSSGTEQRRCWHFPEAKSFPSCSCDYSGAVVLRVWNTIFLSPPRIRESKISLEQTGALDGKNPLLPRFYLKYNLLLTYKTITYRCLGLSWKRESNSFPCNFEVCHFPWLIGMLLVILACFIFFSVWVLEGLTQLCSAFLVS